MNTQSLLSILAPALVAAVTGCDNVTEPSQLDHAQILAVRMTPPALGPGEEAAVDLLVALDSGEVLEVSPDEVTVEDGALTSMGGEVRGDAQSGWRVRAPGAEQIAAGRAALGLDEDAPLQVAVAVSVVVDGVPKSAQKSIVLGGAGENPTLGSFLIAGSPGEELEAGLLDELDVEVEVALEETSGTAPDALRVAWYTSLGTVERYRSPVARYVAEATGQGHLVAVVRDDAGGVAWSTLPLRVE